ncbi:MAG TPA: hypothetical protein VMH26_14755 [Burkholderiales bacterium]|nr:hypothetical protein [Burkholderiales bacterium]
MQRCQSNWRRGAAGQEGVIVFIALIVLVAMTLAAIAVIRSTDSGNVIAGNLAFKQGTTNASDQVLEAAYRWLINTDVGNALSNDNAAAGYWSSNPSPEPNWTSSAYWAANSVCVNACAPDANGNITRYVIHRMCQYPNTNYNGNGPGGQPQSCATLAAGGAGSGGSMSVGSHDFQPTPQLYYRVTTLVTGPRNTQSIVQAMLVLSN